MRAQRNLLTIFSIFIISAYSEDCVRYTFEEDFETLFTNESFLCSRMSFWEHKNYTSIAIDSPHESSYSFISPNENLSCVASFLFNISSGGTVEVSVYIDGASQNDQISILVLEYETGLVYGNILISPFDSNFLSGWQNFKLNVMGVGSFLGQISLLGMASSSSIALVDSFKYYGPGVDPTTCVLYEVDEAPASTTENTIIESTTTSETETPTQITTNEPETTIGTTTTELTTMTTTNEPETTMNTNEPETTIETTMTELTTMTTTNEPETTMNTNEPETTIETTTTELMTITATNEPETTMSTNEPEITTVTIITATNEADSTTTTLYEQETITYEPELSTQQTTGIDLNTTTDSNFIETTSTLMPTTTDAGTTQIDPTERPVMDDSNIWNPFRITIFILLVILILAAIAAISYDIGKSRSNKKMESL